MELHTNRWYVQWFFLSLRVIDRFTGGNDEYWHAENGMSTNLCQFMRVTLIWAPLVVALNLAVYGLVLSALIFVPLYYFGLDGSLTIYGAILIFFTAVALLAFLFWVAVTLTSIIRDGSSELAYVLRRRKERKAAERTTNGPSFGSLIWQYVVAVKRRVCPIITFKQA